MELGTKEFNDSAMEMFGGKPKQQTAVEWLEEQLNNVKPTQFCSIETIKEWIKQAKEMENQQQGYSEEEVLVLLHKRDKHNFDRSLWQTPKEWLTQFKNK